MRLRHKLLLTSFLILPLLAGFVGVFNLQKASAVSAGDWRPGRIIDDVVFFNKDSMSVAQIQAFLDAKVPVCDRWRASSNPNYQPPYTCLKEYQENTSTGESNYGRFNPDGTPLQIAGGKSAAQIIWEEAQNYNINPQSLIVMLQKEQSLVTDDWPWLIQYQKAMGQSCPDTAPCDPAFAGFYNQVSGAAWQLRHYINHPEWFNYRAGVTRNVLYNPNSGCGSTGVYIENNATAALYNYTPYQPNQAALNNLYGTGDGCSSYGNRNFWRLFNDWFGSTQAPNYSWQLTEQYAYTNSSKTAGADIFNLSAGQRIYIGFKAKNTGNRTWSKTGSNPVRVGTLRSYGRQSPVCDSSWISCSRPSNLVEDQVAPGAIGTFEFWVQIPEIGGQFNEYFGLLSEGDQWLPDIGLNFPLKTPPSVYSWSLTGQYAYANEEKTIPINLENLTVGRKARVGVQVKNTGNVTWFKNGRYPVRLGTTGPNDRVSSFCDAWLSCGRPTGLVEDQVAPGGTGTFEFWYTPKTTGSYFERFVPMIEGYGWMQNIGLGFSTQVNSPNASWSLISQYAYTDATKTTGADLSNLSPGESVYIGFRAKNTGNVVWKNNGSTPVRVGTVRPYGRASAFCDTTWVSCGRPANMSESQVAPGEIASFEFWYKAPSTPGIYQEYFAPLIEGVQWMQDIGMQFYTRVL